MKNIKLYGLVGLCGILLLTGCGGDSHTLNCEVKENGQEIKVEVEFDSDEKKAETVTMNITYDAGEDVSNEELEQSKEAMKESICSDKYDSCDVSVDGNKVNVKLVGKGEKLDLTGSLEDTKTSLESNGYKCN